MDSFVKSSTLKSRVTRWIALPSLLILLPNYLALAAVTCDAGFETDSFSAADYTRLAPISSPPAPRTNQAIDGNSTESYLIGSNSLALNGALTPNSTNVYQSATVANTQVFQLAQDFADKNSSRTVSYTFKNKFTDQAQPLNKLSLSIYDIDSSIAGFDSQNTRYFSWFDQVTINGFTSTGAPVAPIVESKGAGITSTAPYRQNSVTSSAICNGLDENCRLSVTFTDPVVRVDVVYGNNPALNYSSNNLANNDPAIQVVNIKFDSYCYKPQPRLTYTKALSAPRKVNTDQFIVQIKDNADNSVVTNSITSTTTTGSSNTVTTGTGTTGTFKVNPTKTYTLTEAVSGTTNLADYTALYACRRSDGTTVNTLDPKNLKLTYGDNWECTITNGRSNYNFSGFVFNDNGGITASSSTQYDTSATFTGNGNYANGIFDSNESGIYVSGLQVRLTDCSGNNLSTTSANPQTVSNAAGTLGQYSFTVLPSVLLNKTKVCIIETEPNTWEYPIDTTADSREVTLASNVYDYKTEKNTSGVITRNLDFGELKSQNATLVLKKSQYVHQCNASLNYASIGDTNDPNTGFSMNAANNVKPGNCIAYKIDAYNRGHIDIVDVQIKDILQTAPVISTFQLPKPTGNPSNVYQSSNTSAVMGNNGTIVSDKFDLVKVPTATTVPTKASLYFNSKYGTTTSTP